MYAPLKPVWLFLAIYYHPVHLTDCLPSPYSVTLKKSDRITICLRVPNSGEFQVPFLFFVQSRVIGLKILGKISVEFCDGLCTSSCFIGRRACSNELSMALKKVWSERMACMIKVYQDMWLKGLFVTSGTKFGCDYLAYEGSVPAFNDFSYNHLANITELYVAPPEYVHSIWTVKVADMDSIFPVRDIVSWARSANTAAKDVQICYWDHCNNQVKAVRLGWVRWGPASSSNIISANKASETLPSPGRHI